eukprot:CAMPEP_0113281542 /NCGR_PEP_ID=MMETSP0008_2-20120614/28352_1 /TAXON_ID=97485 /ORGANISM="Prymnesium parvum" /LENGTH=84 /DNA_ID=CAMNT_0000131957 /DNA_START=74 /DNA_END=326 /DNA_ORIENTATION=- /assembly_acc=CAM_ASM_000153
MSRLVVQSDRLVEAARAQLVLEVVCVDELRVQRGDEVGALVDDDELAGGVRLDPRADLRRGERAHRFAPPALVHLHEAGDVVGR